MNILDIIKSNVEYVILGVVIGIVILMLLLIIQGIKLSKLKKKYKAFMEGKEAASLEEVIIGRFNEIDGIKKEMGQLNTEVEQIKENLMLSYQKIGIVKYDAFKEMGGKLSFALAMLNEKNDGFILNSMHSSREGCYTYAKEIIHGESFVVLAKEEKKALEIALKSKNYME